MDEVKRDEELQEEIEEIEQVGETSEEPEELEEVVEEVYEEIVEEPPKHSLPKRLLAQPAKIGAALPKAAGWLKNFIVECKRVLRVTKKPNKEEFLMIVKVSALGMAVIGLLGFLIHFVKEFLV